MDKSATHHRTFILKVNINCCNSCPKKLKNFLLNIEGVEGVDIDRQKRLVYVTGKVDPQKLINMIGKLRKTAEFISYVKEPEEKDDMQKNVKEMGKVMKDKGKGKEKKHSHNGSNDDDCCIHNDFYHKPEAYVKPPPIDERICRDMYCKVHPRKPKIIRALQQQNASMNWQAPPQGFFFSPPPPHSQFPGMYPPEGDYYRRMQPPPRYGYPTMPMPGLDPEYYGDGMHGNRNTRGCTTM